MAPRKPKKTEPEFPPECCGVCKFAQKVDGEWKCFVLPAQAVVVNDTPGWVGRGTAIELKDPACGEFKPRCHA